MSNANNATPVIIDNADDGYTTTQASLPITIGRDENGGFTFAFPDGMTDEEKRAWTKEFYAYWERKNNGHI